MGGLRGQEILIILILLILVFGWKRLPDAARSLGRSARVFKSEVEEMKKDGKNDAADETVQGQSEQRPAPQVTPPPVQDYQAPPGQYPPQVQQPQYQPAPQTQPQETPHQGQYPPQSQPPPYQPPVKDQTTPDDPTRPVA